MYVSGKTFARKQVAGMVGTQSLKSTTKKQIIEVAPIYITKIIRSFEVRLFS